MQGGSLGAKTSMNPAETAELHIDKLLYRWGKLSVYTASYGDFQRLFYFYQCSALAEVAWLQKSLAHRQQMLQDSLAAIMEHGWIDEGGYAWSYDVAGAIPFTSVFQEKPENPLRVLRLVFQLAQGVEELHAQGVFHGDFRDKNLWIRSDSDDGEHVLLVGEELGLWNSSHTWVDADLSFDNAFYLSPEVAAGAIASSASDVYAIGVLLYRALFGKMPFDGDSIWEISAAHATQPLEKPKMVLSVHPELWELIVACLHKDPQIRLDVATVVERLQPFVDYAVPVYVDMELTDPNDIPVPSPYIPLLDMIDKTGISSLVSQQAVGVDTTKKDIVSRVISPKTSNIPARVTGKTLDELDFVITQSSIEITEEMTEQEKGALQVATLMDNSAYLPDYEQVFMEPRGKIESKHTMDTSMASPISPKSSKSSSVSYDTVVLEKSEPDITQAKPEMDKPIKVLVGAISAHNPETDNTDLIEHTNNVPVVPWLQTQPDNSVVSTPLEGIIEFDEITQQNTSPVIHKHVASIVSKKPVHHVAENPVLDAPSTVDTKLVMPVDKTHTSLVSTNVQFVIFTILSSIATVLVLQIVAKLVGA